MTHHANTGAKGNNSSGLSRRQVLAGLAAGAASVTVGKLFASRAQGAVPASPASPTATEGKIKLAVAPRVEPFALSAVRLLEGPFLAAQKRDEKYLLSLEPDRMLHNFRVNAGLEPKAPVYGGWESVQTWADIRAHGHTLGHYLTACAMMFASTGDEEFKKRCQYIVAELQECQKTGTMGGLVCAWPDKTAPIDALVAGRRAIGVPWYTLHKIFAGLRDVHLQTGSPEAKDVLVKLSDWAFAATEKMTDAQFQRMLGTEHGGMNEVLADVYAMTGEPKHLALAERFCHHAVMDPLAAGRDTLDTLHSNTQIPKFIGFKRLHELTGKPEYLAAAKFFWQTVTRTRSFATGGNGDQEHFFAIKDFEKHLSSPKTMETCCSYNMLKLTRMLIATEPDVEVAEYANYYERTLYNTILASQDPDSGMMTYFQPTKPGYVKIFCTPVDSFWCCTGTGIENHSKYGDSIYFHSADALHMNLFMASTVTWKEKGIALTQETNFPDEPKTKLTFTADAPVEMTLNIRRPSWCKSVAVRMNGAAQTSGSTETAKGYISLRRTWKTGDVVEVDLPMALRTELLPGTTDTLVVAYGPLVLAGKLGMQGITPGSDIVVNERLIGTMLNDAVDVPSLTGDGTKVVDAIKPVEGKALTFVAPAAGRADGVTMVPYFRVAHERYNLYWKVVKA